MRKKELEVRFQKLQELTYSYKKQANIYAILRLMLCVVIVVDLLMGYFQKKPYLYLVSLIALIAFLVCVRVHQKVFHKYLLCNQKCQVYQSHLLRMVGSWNQNETGDDMIKDENNLSSDLDLFGHHSLYQMINICVTKRGKLKLAHELSKQSLSYQDIKERQKAVEELSTRDDFIYDIETYGHFLKDIDQHELQQMKQASYSLNWIYLVLPCLTILSLIMVLFRIMLPYSAIVLEIGLVLQMIIAFLFYIRHQKLFQPIIHLQKSLFHYMHIFQLIEQQEFHSPYLQNLQKKFVEDRLSTRGIQELSQIALYIGYRQNILLFVLLNALCSYDKLCAFQYQKWVSTYGHQLDGWLEALADLEVCMSLSVIKLDDFDVCMPQVTSKMNLSFQDLRHPLINPQKVVGNDWSLKNNMNVITGSNMSGKTTFMRSIALNLVLAYAGGFVFAQSMCCSPMKIYTSMRVKDNVEEGISTFYGELMRVKMMIEATHNQEPMICFIDEIFKGTNSLDRIAGAKATIEKLSLSHCLTFITTHDFELCSTTQVDLHNYHFDEYYQENQIYFPYLIQDGQSQSTNGQFLLKQLGIMEE